MKYYRLSDRIRDLMNKPLNTCDKNTQDGGAIKKNTLAKKPKKSIKSDIPIDYSDVELENKVYVRKN